MDNLTDHEKSTLLCRLAGIPIERDLIIANLYNPNNMDLAWTVLNYFEDLDMSTPSLNWRLFEYPLRTLACESPPVAQRLWLDKILSLAIEAGIVELEEENQ